MGKNRTRRDTGRDGGPFIALPWSVTDTPSYARLSFPARALLVEFARQFVRDNNGRMLASRNYLAPRGWASTGAIKRAKDELLAAGFIFQTVIGQRPNKASWYAVTWHRLDPIPGYDAGTKELFVQGTYRLTDHESATPKAPQKRDQARVNGRFVRPSHGLESSAIAPSHGLEVTPLVPPHGAIRPTFDASLRPSHGHHLEVPSPAPTLAQHSKKGKPRRAHPESSRGDQ